MQQFSGFYLHESKILTLALDDQSSLEIRIPRNIIILAYPKTVADKDDLQRYVSTGFKS